MIEHNDEIELRHVTEFDPAKIFTCGQCFRWTPGTPPSGSGPEVWTGVAMGRAVRVRREGGSVFLSCSPGDFKAVWHRYFDLDRDYAAARARLERFSFLREAADFGAGIRILNQDPWEALCTFILSQCNNIPRIRAIVESLCCRFGDPVALDGATLYAFPPAERIAGLNPEDLAPLRCGYRGKYILSAARAVADGTLDLAALTGAPHGDTLKTLKTLEGVGDKVAGCVMLFSLGIAEAFPVDVWMRRAVVECFPAGFDPAALGKDAGLAQQYLFFHQRSNAHGVSLQNINAT